MEEAAFIDRHRGALRAFMVLGPPVSGWLFPLTGYLNPLWSSLFGFPLHLAIAMDGSALYGPALLFALLLWPLVVLGASTWASGEILESQEPMRTTLTILWVATVLMLVPLDAIVTYFADWPLNVWD